MLVIDPLSGEDHTIFPVLPGQPGDDLLAEQQGAINFSADGKRVLIAETVGGRVFEAEVGSGRTLWQMNAISDLRPFQKLTGQTDGKPNLMRVHTQGAQYVTLADLRRWSASN